MTGMSHRLWHRRPKADPWQAEEPELAYAMVELAWYEKVRDRSRTIAWSAVRSSGGNDKLGNR
jgi:hypothetical protein